MPITPTGRNTASAIRAAAGAAARAKRRCGWRPAVIAKKWLAETFGVRVRGYLAQIGDVVPRIA